MIFMAFGEGSGGFAACFGDVQRNIHGIPIFPIHANPCQSMPWMFRDGKRLPDWPKISG
jgi:hypothetical protein